MASPLRYPGGKGGLYSRLRALIRDNGLSGCTYVEPYAGGAGAGIGLLITGQVERVVINDLDPAVHSFWAALVADPDDLIRRIDSAKLNVREWNRQKDIFRNSAGADLQDRGFATFYLNRTNHSGVLNAGPIGGIEQRGTYKIDARFNREDLKERIRVIALYASKISVSEKDGTEVIEDYGRRADAFIYADPPYFEKAGSLYMNAFAAADHESLASVLGDLADRNWLLTYDNVPQVHELYAERRRRTYQLNYSARRVAKATEIAVLSDSLADLPDGWTLAPDG